MKRIEILNKAKDDKNNVNFDSVTKRDKATITAEKSKRELALLTVEESIESYLKDPNMSLDSQFLTLFRQKESIQSEIELLDKIAKEYL